MICELVTTEDYPPGALATWEDQGSKYCLRRRETPITTRTPPAGDSRTGSFYCLAETTCHWELSPNIFLKSKSRVPGMGLESETIAWVREKFPDIPVTNVIYGWADQAWERSFMISRRAKGELLETAWPRLSILERKNIAQEVALILEKLATETSETFQRVGGQITFFKALGIPERDVSRLRDITPSTYLPQMRYSNAIHLHPKYTAAEIDEAVRKWYGRKERMPRTEKFVFSHNDLCPVNLFVSKEGDGKARLMEIIDWEHASFVPQWYLTTMCDFPFREGNPHGWQWSRALVLAMESWTDIQPVWRWPFPDVYDQMVAEDEADMKFWTEFEARMAKEAMEDELARKLANLDV